MSNLTPLILLFFLSSFFSPLIGGDTLSPTQSLADGQTLISASGRFALGFFSPSGTKNRYVGMWYNKVPIQTVVWVANRRDPVADPTGILSISGNGSLAITARNSTVLWSTPASAASNSVAQLLDSGNFVIREANASDPLSFGWQSFDHPTDTLLPGMKVGLNLTSGLNRNLTSWTSESDPAPGTYTAGMDARGDPQFFLWAGATPVWRCGPWDGVQLSGVPDMKNQKMLFKFVFEDDRNEITFGDEISYGFTASVISHMIISQSGQWQRLVWLDTSSSWSVFWFAPKDQCDSFAECGPYGLCDLDNFPICSCLQGFDPKSPKNWALRDASEGCVRRTALDCRNGSTDGFVVVAEAKLPDTSRAVVDRSMSLDDCRAACLRNCSCNAYASANISGSGSGCIIWTTEITDLRVFTSHGQDVYVRLAAADLGSKSNQSHNSGILVVAIVVGLVSGALFLGCITCCIWKKMKKEKEQKKRRGVIFFSDHYDDESVQEEDLELPLFDLGTIAIATDNFSIDNKLGQGGFGPVYKGKLGDGIQIAVKRLSRTSGQGLCEFKNEVMLIAKLQHRNLVRLLGGCVQGGERMLIYEYMHNKSLDIFLFDKAKHAKLDWKTRYDIILGIARGLLYLHQDSRLRIIHRDLKPSNILLDEDMNPKISDFGLARIFGGDEPEVNTMKVVGTYGYMSPEYVLYGIFSVKSDVFSFGVLVLEIISGKKNRGASFSGNSNYLLRHAWNLWIAGNCLELVDESIGYSFSLTEALRFINVGLLCVQERPEDRPTMALVVLMMSGGPLPRPKQPGFVTTSGPSDMENTINEISVTKLEGR